MKIALVYQAGIANVFEVDFFLAEMPKERKARRILQHAFGPCEFFCRGAKIAGSEVVSFACNQAGDISDAIWTRDLTNQPFSNKFKPV